MVSAYEDAPEPFEILALTADQALARARRALEKAELAVDAVEADVVGSGDANRHWTLAFAKQRARIGRGWAELGAALRRAER